MHAIWSFDLGGAEVMLIDIVNRQVACADVAVLIGNAIVNEALLSTLAKEVSVYRVGRPPGSRNPWYLYKMSRAARTFRPDVIHAHSPTVIAAIPFSSARTVLTVHDTANRLTSSARKYDLVASISRVVQSHLAKSQIASTLIYNGIDFGSIVPRQWGVRSGPFRVIQVSRLVVDKKGQDILLGALKTLGEIVGGGAVQVDFVGDGPDLDRLRMTAKQLGVDKNCRFLGPMSRDDVYRILPTYDALVQPSRTEGFGLTVIEGVAAGLPVVCTDIEGPREIFSHAPNGYLFTPGSASDCAQKLLEVMKQSTMPDFGERMQRTRQALVRLFDINETASAYLREYQRLLRAA